VYALLDDLTILLSSKQSKLAEVKEDAS
jgi:hypothetical protein